MLQPLIDELTIRPLRQPYSLNKEVTLTTDGSEKTIGGVCTQNGHPVIYVIRSLSKLVQKDSKTERAASAVVFAVTRLRHFQPGRNFTLKIDHKPLRYIFCPNIQLPKVISDRLARWVIILMPYDSDVQNVPGQEIGHAVSMSRLRFKDNGIDLVATIRSTFEKHVIYLKLLQREMANDHFNKRRNEKLRKGKRINCTKMVKEVAKKTIALTIQNDLICKGSRMYIPVPYRKQIIEKLLDIHQCFNALQCFVKNVIMDMMSINSLGTAPIVENTNRD